MNRRRFIATLAAPLIFLGIFTGNHVSGVDSTTYTTASISPSKNRIVVVMVCDNKGRGTLMDLRLKGNFVGSSSRGTL